MQTITFGNFKGGVGKTTNAVLVSRELAKRGNKTLLVDLDPQGNATNVMLKTGANIQDEVIKFDQSLMNAISEGNLNDSIITIDENWDLLGSGPDFALYGRWLEHLGSYNKRVQYLDKLINPLKMKYDYIILDTPPTQTEITDSALYTSDFVVIVMQTQEHAYEGALSYVTYISKDIIGEFGAKNIDVAGILPVQLQAGATVDELTLENANRDFGEKMVFDHIVKYMQRLKRYAITGITTGTRFDQRVFDVYKGVTDELLERVGGED
ncbi:AAA family ATPase (plasmid) [Lacticaseibacillus paracasei]|uniref:ParA family protein n=1 Tax=Lacticaseibacillus paracasei TaxID=1597 RepID=UPI0021AED9D8|nr:ParA family protein [Lacticaseibacillus paracasei]UWY26085.1 AAA family ATPase [Lacticaseibacillus paracasei]